MDQTKIWDHFQNTDETGDAFINALPRYKFLANQIQSGMAVLNIGVGRGGLEAILVKKKVVVYCLDPNPESIDRLRRQHDLGLRAQVGFSQSMPFRDGELDAVIMSEVLEHLTNDVMHTTLAEVRRVLKPNGLFIGTVPANERLMDNKVVCPHCGEPFHRWGHMQSFSPLRIREVLTARGFTVERVETRAFPSWRRGGLKNLCKSLIRYALGRAGAQIANPSLYFKAARKVI